MTAIDATDATTVESVRMWWNERSKPTRVLLAIAGAAVALNVVLWFASNVTGSPPPKGPPSSSYSTTPLGLAAYADLLARAGHPIERFRDDLDKVEIPPDTTLVVADAALSDDEQRAVIDAVHGGARLIVLGAQSTDLLASLLGPRVVWSAQSATRTRVAEPTPETAGVAVVTSDLGGSFANTGRATPVLVGEDGLVLAAAGTAGRGRVVMVASSGPFLNERLDKEDNATFAVAVAGDVTRPVSFAEAPHGYGRTTGLSALPAPVKLFFVLSAIAAAMWMWSRGRRMGPPEDRERRLAPPRRLFVESIAATLARTGDRAGAIEPLRADARGRIARRAGLGSQATDDEIRAAAERIGVAAGDIDALFRPIVTDDDVVAAGYARARLEERSR